MSSSANFALQCAFNFANPTLKFTMETPIRDLQIFTDNNLIYLAEPILEHQGI